MLLSAVREMDAGLRPALRGPFDGAQARKLLELMHRTCDAHGWTHEQLQALAEGYNTEPDLAPVFASAWSSWASLLPSSLYNGGSTGSVSEFVARAFVVKSFVRKTFAGVG